MVMECGADLMQKIQGSRDACFLSCESNFRLFDTRISVLLSIQFEKCFKSANNNVVRSCQSQQAINFILPKRIERLVKKHFRRDRAGIGAPGSQQKAG